MKTIVDQKFGKLLILNEYVKRSDNGRSVRYVEAKCDCGNIKEIRKEKVVRGMTKSCGCLQYQMRKSLGIKRRKPYGISAFNECYAAYRKSAEIRGYDFKLDKEEFEKIITLLCIYCGESFTQEKKASCKNSGSFKYTGIDRYDNSKGYVLDNCVPCCKICNQIKSCMTPDELETRLTIMISRKSMWKRTA
jgi:hypothetical protein